MKKLISLLLVLLLLVSIAVPAFATGEGDDTSGGGTNLLTDEGGGDGGGTGGEGGGTGGDGGGGGTDNPPCTHSWTNACDTTCDLNCGYARSTSHAYDNACDTACNVCGDIRTVSHSFGSWADNGSGGHTRVCTVCTFLETGTHSCTSWTPGDTGHTGTCATCSAAMSGTHTFGNWASADATNHTRACTACGKTETGAHSWNSGTVTTAATCSATGVKTFTCQTCSGTKTESVEKDPNNHTFTAWTITDTTHSRSCTGCPRIESGSHSWNVTITKAATCKEAGSKTSKCTACDKEVTEAIAKLTTHTYDNDCDEKCNVCDEPRTVEHKYNTYYSKNSTSHWIACSKCTAKKNVGNHVPGPLPTEDKAQVCLTCNYELQAKLKHTHKFDEDEWESDKTGHWHECDDCGVEVEFDDHTYSGKCGAECSVCGYVNENGHIYDGSYETDKVSHWSICTVCGVASTPENHIPGPEPTAAKPQTCTICDYEIAVLENHEHTLGDWISNEAEHWKQCECGEKLEQGVHAWDEGEKGKDNTVTRTCIDCGETMTEIQTAKKNNTPWILLLVVLVVCFCATLAILIKLILNSRQTGRYS